MREDIGFYIEARIDAVYQAYLNAAVNKPFERSCKQEPYHTISFGVNYSFKYNMNGGACTIHFMPYGTGTAVDMRFSIAQLAGARYEKYANDLNKAMQAFLPVTPQPAKFNINDFLNPANQVTPASFGQNVAPQAPAPMPAATPAPMPAAAPASAAEQCRNCGNPLLPNERFCGKCGTSRIAPAPKICPNCNKPVDNEGYSFCSFCGTRL